MDGFLLPIFSNVSPQLYWNIIDKNCIYLRYTSWCFHNHVYILWNIYHKLTYPSPHSCHLYVLGVGWGERLRSTLRKVQVYTVLLTFPRLHIKSLEHFHLATERPGAWGNWGISVKGDVPSAAAFKRCFVLVLVFWLLFWLVFHLGDGKPSLFSLCQTGAKLFST